MPSTVRFLTTQIPPRPSIPAGPEPAQDTTVARDLGGDVSSNGGNPFGLFTQRAVVGQQATGAVRVSAPIVEGLLIHKFVPPYPPIAVASGTEGTVVLEATISRSGAIENLHVVSGPVLLRRAALNAVQTWRYRPYLLNGEPVEVETTINVIFKLH